MWNINDHKHKRNLSDENLEKHLFSGFEKKTPLTERNNTAKGLIKEEGKNISLNNKKLNKKKKKNFC